MPVKPPLRVGAVSDPMEAEADHFATQALAAPVAGEPAPLAAHRSRRSAPLVQASGAAPASVGHTLAQPGSRLDAGLQRDMGQRFGHDFSQVRVHTGTLASQSAHELDAQAYTVGHNVVFGAGRYAPHTSAGRSLVAHELAHTLQQHVGAHAPGSQGEWVQRAPKPQTRPNASEPAVLDVIKKTLTRKGLPFSTEVEIEVSNIKGVKGKVKLRFDVVYQGDRLYLVEAKGADPDSLTDNQRLAHRALQEHGGSAKVTQVGGTPPGATRVRDVVALVKGDTWQIKPGDMQHVNGRFTASIKPQAASQPNSMVVTVWEEAMDAMHTDAVPRKPGDVRVLKPNERERFVPQSELSDPTLTPQNKPKPKTPQRFEHPKKPPSPLRLGSFDDEDGLRVPGRRRAGADDASGGRQRARIGAAAQADGPHVAEEPKRVRIADPRDVEAKSEARAVDEVLAGEADKRKPKSTQRFEYPEKPTAHPRPGSVDEEAGRPARGRQVDPNRGPGGTKPFFRKLEQTKPIPTHPVQPPVGTEVARSAPKLDQTKPVAVEPPATQLSKDLELPPPKPPIKAAPLQVDADAATLASRNTAPGTGWNIAGHGATLGIDLLAAWVHNENTKSRIEKLTKAKLSELQPEFDKLVTQRPKKIHAVVTLTLTVVTTYSGRPWGVEESVGPPMVRLDMHLATAGAANAEEMDDPSFSILGSNKSETTRVTYSFLVLDLEAEGKRQARKLQDSQRQDKLEAFNKALEQSQKPQAKPKPKAKAASRGAAGLAPSMAEPASLLPWPTQSGGRADQKKETKGAWTIGLQIRDEAIALRNESTAHQRKVFALKVALYRDQVQIMIRDFSDHEMTQSLMKLLYQFDEVMRQRFVEIGIANYPE